MAAGELPSHNLPFVEEQYARYLHDERSVDETWRAYFRSFGPKNGATLPQPSFGPRSIFAPRGLAPAAGAANAVGTSAAPVAAEFKADRVTALVQAYRFRGHLFAKLDPLGLERPPAPDIDLVDFGLDASDLDTTFTAGGMRGTLRELIAFLEETYCRTIGVEVAHIEDKAARIWLRDRMEGSRNRIALTKEEEVHLLTKLTDAEIFEQFLHTKFVGAKRFSLEGAESMIPLIERILLASARQGAEEVVIGMAHRGRLNVLANVLDMPAREIFAEFDDADPQLYLGKGDVKYHLGYSSDREFEGRKLHLSLSFNPSHLEFVDAVVMGRARAKQTRRGDAERRKVLPILIHGDAAFAGQGIVSELFNMAELPGYHVGGTVHVVVNNQIGFTTLPKDSRSTRYATDIAKMMACPIFHVNGEDPEAVAQVVQLAAEYRHTFNRDVVIDLYCYRKHGHNETDEPAFTQPLMYKTIASHPSVRDQYVRKLVGSGHLTQEHADRIAVARKQALEEQLAETRSGYKRRKPSALAGLWGRYAGGVDRATPDVPTGVELETLKKLGRQLATVPEGFRPHPKLQKLLEQRGEMAEGSRPLDWGMAEALGFGTLAAAGVRVRITGQDSERGTFSHRHAVLYDFETGATHTPLVHVATGSGGFEVRNSPLSEVAVLGYEYGYSLDTPDGLVIWEAQFGDFSNAAQVIIDQFIASGEDKWNRLSGLALFLPHGYEGAGPEHSSARLERFLNLCAEDNMQVCYPSSAAQIFHLIRRQVLRPIRKPLIVMTPKSLLRLPQASSPLEELAKGTFQRVIADPAHGSGKDPGKVQRVILCTGKIFFELEKERNEKGRDDVALVRVEQLYPTPLERIGEELARYPNHREVVWVQEEPRNLGARTHMLGELSRSGLLRKPLHWVSRPASASPATGSNKSHQFEQRRVLEEAFAPIA